MNYILKKKYLKESNKERTRLLNNTNPVPTIHPKEIQEKRPSTLPNIVSSRKAPFQRIFQADELESKAYNKLKIASFSDIGEHLLKYLEKNYKFSSHEDHAVFYKIETNEMSIPLITESIRIDDKLRVRPSQVENSLVQMKMRSCIKESSHL